MLRTGFDAVYDDPSDDLLEGLHTHGKLANVLDPLTFTGERFHRSLRYAENHDAVRLANPKTWGGLGMEVGRPVSAVLFGMGRRPLMIYHCQEVGEPALGAERFGGDDARTTIFDYGSTPECVKWVNDGKCDGGRLSDAQKELRAWYGKLLAVTREPAFTGGEFYGLNHANNDNPAFGRVGDETASGHWVYAFLRHDRASGQAFLVVANSMPPRRCGACASAFRRMPRGFSGSMADPRGRCTKGTMAIGRRRPIPMARRVMALHFRICSHFPPK